MVEAPGRQRRQRQADSVASGVAQLDDRFGEDALSVVGPAEFEVPVAQVVEGSAKSFTFAEPSADLHLPLQRIDRTVDMAHDTEQASIAVQCICQHVISKIGVEGEEVVAPLQPLAVLTGCIPQVAEAPDQTARCGEVPVVECVAQRSSELGLVLVEPKQRAAEVAGALLSL